MTEKDPQCDYAAMFKALGDPTRLQIFEFLRAACRPISLEEDGAARPLEGSTAGEVCCHITGLEKINSTISHHLKELRLAGLIQAQKCGKQIYCCVNEEAVLALKNFLGADAPAPKLLRKEEILK